MNILLTIIITLIIVIVFFEIIIRYLIGESLIGIFLEVLHDRKEIKKPDDFGERENEDGINDGCIKMDNGIKNEIKRIQKAKKLTERIRYRKECEDEAIVILKNIKTGELSQKQAWKIVELLDEDYKNGRRTNERFGVLLLGNNRKNIKHCIKNRMDDMNQLFEEVYNNENLDDFNSIIKPLDGINKGFVTCLLYLKDRERYNIFIGATREGIERIFPEKSNFKGSFKNQYKLFNELVNEVRKECDLEPQEVDLILTNFSKYKL